MASEDKLLVPNKEENYWTKSRLELRTWFQKNGPPLGQLYEGALIMLHCPSFPGRVRFISHSVREIRNRLPDYIAGPKTKSRFDWKTRLDDVGKDWGKEGLLIGIGAERILSPEEKLPSNSVPVPRWLVKKVSNLIKDHLAAREKREEAAIRLFEGVSLENQGLRDILRPQVKQWLAVTEWFMEQTHEGFTDNDVNMNEFRDKFELFEVTLGALLSSFFKTVEGIDEILEDTNS